MRNVPFNLGILFFLSVANAAHAQTGVAHAVSLKPDPSLTAAPSYDPIFWSRDKNIWYNNNCYAYAANDIDTAEFGAYPGYRTLGKNFPEKYASYDSMLQELIKGAQSDGMIFTGKKTMSRPGFYRVVLMAHPRVKGEKYDSWHWMRQDNTGIWSYKDGSSNAITNLDNERHPIMNPETANLGEYKVVGYFLVPKGGLDVGSPNEPMTHPGSRPAFMPTLSMAVK